jgi:hypothetical protein
MSTVLNQISLLTFALIYYEASTNMVITLSVYSLNYSGVWMLSSMNGWEIV